MNEEQILAANQENYHKLYSKQEAFLRYPADWVIRFHNMYLKRHLPTGRVLDYGCGGGNNSVFLVEKGYETYGVDTSPAALPLVHQNLQSRNLDDSHLQKFAVIPPDCTRLPFDDGFFDFVLSNQVLYYLPSERHIKTVCAELARCLRPGGIVFFTMMGPRNSYITHHTKQVHNGNVHEVRIDTPGHRLFGVCEMIYLVPDAEALKQLFSEFECISTGYFDQSMLDMYSNFHWIFIGRKTVSA